MLDDLDLSGIRDERSRTLIVKLVNIIEDLNAELQAVKAENQRLRDENNHLKGEQGKPQIKANTKPKPTDHSSERERHQPIKHKKQSKINRIKIDRTETLYIDRELLTRDTQFKCY